MKRLLFLLLSLGCMARSWAEKPVISVTDLLRTETRLRAFHEFQLQMQPERLERLEITKLEDFARFYRQLAVNELPGGRDGVHYLVTWSHDFTSTFEQGWPDAKAAGDPDVRQPENVAFQVFASNGSPLSIEVQANKGVVLDVDGDGLPEVIQQLGFSKEGGPIPIPGGAATGSKPSTEYEFLKVSRSDPGPKSSFALLYNANPSDRLPGNLWGFQVRQVAATGATTIELGPCRLPTGIEPKVVFRWDKVKRAWIGPKRRPGDHFLVLKAGSEMADAQRMAARDELRYSLVEPPETLADFAPREDKLLPSASPALEPYRARSLAALSDEELWIFMAGGREKWEEQRERRQVAMTVPDFWRKEPKSAALAYVRRNRDSRTRELYTTSIPAIEEAAPGDGDLTCSSFQAFDLGPYISTLHHLHFAPEGSCLLRMEWFNRTAGLASFDGRDHWDVRRLDLSYEQARQLFHTLWWMSRVRAQYFRGARSFGSECNAIVTFHSHEESVALGNSYEGGTEGEGYSPAIFAALTSQLFETQVADWLGEAWRNQASPVRFAAQSGLPVAHTPALWTKRDPYTRARMLVAFTLGQAATFADEYNGALEYLDRQLASLRVELTLAQVSSVAAYVA